LKGPLKRKKTEIKLCEQGCFEANPPFVPVVVETMAQHIDALLLRSSPRHERCDNGSGASVGSGGVNVVGGEGGGGSGIYGRGGGGLGGGGELKHQKKKGRDSKEEEGGVEYRDGSVRPLCFVVVIPHWSPPQLEAEPATDKVLIKVIFFLFLFSFRNRENDKKKRRFFFLKMLVKNYKSM